MHIWQTEMPQNAAFNMGLHCLLKYISIEIHYDLKTVTCDNLICTKNRP